MKIEVLVDVKTTLGEGPLWDVEEQRLYWVDSSPADHCRNTDDEREASNLLAVSPIDECAPEAIGPIEDKPKDGF
jgi:sugar lactone lactonase YvrE